MSTARGVVRLAVTALAATFATSTFGQCVPAWQGGYELPGLNGAVYAAAMFDDDGAGPRPETLYVGGSFTFAGGARAVGVARWNGNMWEGVGSGFYASLGSPGPGSVRALAVFNGVLYAGGRFSRIGVSAIDNIARWSGSEWVSLDAGGATVGSLPCCTAPQVDALRVHDDGGGAALYLTGFFGQAGGLEVNSIAKWDGQTFSAMGPLFFEGLHGSGPRGWALESFAGDLYVGGDFDAAGTTADTRRIARWDGIAWQSVGSMDTSDRVFALHVFDADAAGPAAPALIVGGDLSRVGIGLAGSSGVSAFGSARWSGSAWSPMSPLVRPDQLPERSAEVLSLTSFLEGGVPRLYAAGYAARGTPAASAGYLHRWSGSGWEAPSAGSPNGQVSFVRGVDLNGPAAGGSSLLASGTFDAVGTIAATNFARLDDASWRAMPAGNAPWTSNSAAQNTGVITGVAVGDEDGAGPRGQALYTYGTLVSAGGVSAPGGIVRKDGSTWTPLGSGPGFKIRTVVFFDDGSGQKLFAISTEGALASWNGTSWTSRAPAVATASRSATVFDVDGPGPARAAIYLSGEILNPDETEFVTAVVKWDGTSATWTPVTSTTPSGLDPRRFVYALLPFNGALYAGGGFVDSGGGSIYGLARYNGTDWTMVATVPGVNESVLSLEVFDNSLFVGGQFVSLGGAPDTRGIARYDGSTWFGVGGGVTGSFPVAYAQVSSLRTADDGSGPALFVGGKFETAGGVAGTRSIAKWNGVNFSPLENGVRSNSIAGPDFTGLIDTPNGDVTSIAGLGGLVSMTGVFNRAGSTISYGFAAWGCAAPACRADFNQSGNVSVQDIFDFLVAYFSAQPAADINGVGGVTVQDIFDFLALYFTGC